MKKLIPIAIFASFIGCGGSYDHIDFKLTKNQEKPVVEISSGYPLDSVLLDNGSIGGKGLSDKFYVDGCRKGYMAIPLIDSGLINTGIVNVSAYSSVRDSYRRNDTSFHLVKATDTQ